MMPRSDRRFLTRVSPASLVLAATLATGFPTWSAPNGPRLEAPRIAGGKFHFNVTGNSTGRLQWEISTNLTTWSPWQEPYVGTLPATVQDDHTTGRAWRFYRVTVLPTVVAFEFTSPPEEGFLEQRLPTFELRVDLDPRPDEVVLRANGDILPCQQEWNASVLRCTPLQPLPTGFVEMTAMAFSSPGSQPPLARRNLRIVPPGTNLAPQTRPDAALASQGIPQPIDVLANDRDPNGDTLRVSSVGTPTQGAARVEDGLLIYTAALGFVGEDRFSYTASDGRGGTTDGHVTVAVRPVPAAVAILIDSVHPGARHTLDGTETLESNLEVALTNLCARLKPGERARLVLRTQQPILAGRLRLGCPIDLVSEPNHRPRIEGPDLGLGVESDAVISGLTFSSPGSIRIQADAGLVMIGNTFLAPVVDVTTSGAGGTFLRTALHSAPLPGRAIKFIDDQGDAFRATGELVGTSVLNVEAGSWNNIDLALDQRERAAVEVGWVRGLGRLKVDGTLSGASTVSMRNLAGVGLIDQKLKAEGEHTTTIDSVVAGQLNLGLEGLGKVSAEMRANRSDQLDLSTRTGRLDWRGSGNVSTRVKLQLDGPAGAVGDIQLTEQGAEVAREFNVVATDQTKVNLGLHAMVARDRVEMGLDGEAEVALDDETHVSGEVHLRSGAKPLRTTVTDSAFSGTVRVTKRTGPVYLYAAASVFSEGIDATLPESGATQAELARVELPNGAGLSLTAGVGLGPDRAQRHSPVLVATPANAGIRVQGARFTGATTARSGLVLQGFQVPVEVVDCVFENANPSGNALLIHEVDAPVTVRGNQFLAGVLVCDGDLEDEGRSGRVRHAYDVSGNRFLGGAARAGVVFQDLALVHFRGNQVTAEQCLTISAGQVIAESNELTATGMTGTVIVVAPAGGVPGALVARSNVLTGGLPVNVIAHGFANLDGNNRFKPAGLFPMSVINVTGSDEGPSYARISGNQFDMATINTGVNGFLEFNDNASQMSLVNDGNKEGGLVTKPSGSGLLLAASSSLVDFNGNDCGDLPPFCDTKDAQGDCGCDGKPVPSAPPWPVF
ncbi:MAG: cadherin-like domain-containing protein [Verrucomicrobiales bacterium]|nr:cadherin-like domain-containing protein [Verrucomicrobiales bacterium]